MDKAFLTGAAGFVGSNVARVLLEKGLSVTALVRKGSPRKNLDGLSIDWAEGDLLDPKSIKAAIKGARYVFHVAADYRLWLPNQDAVDAMYASNIDGTRNVLEAAKEAGAEKIVHCSSVAAIKTVYFGAATEQSVYHNTDEIISHYKKSKWLSERLALNLAKRGWPIVVVNPAAPIGPYDIKPTPTGKIVVDFLNGKIPAYLDTGLNVVHVRDVAMGHYLAAVKGRLGERYILGNENLTFKRIMDILAEATGLAAPRIRTPYTLALAFAYGESAYARLTGSEPRAPIDAVKMARRRMYYDSSKAVRELGLPQTPAKKALIEAARWFAENGYVHERRRDEVLGRLPSAGAAMGLAR